MRSVRFGNLIICKHVFDNYAARYPHLGDFDFDDRRQRVAVARQIKEMLHHCVPVPGSKDQTIFVYLWMDDKTEILEGIAYPADIGRTLTKIVTSYPAGPSLVNKAKLLQDQCRDQCQINKTNRQNAKVVARYGKASTFKSLR